ncbi:MAG: beta-ketoacyl synthase [Desulfobulbaceae bacterium]|nr:beta-ketoacyl synthase [Desulfobulbaceae bacterium]
MNRPVIVAAAALTALGDLEESWQGLMAGRSGLALGPLTAPLNRYPVGLVPGLSGGLGSAVRQGNLYRRLLRAFPELPSETGLLLSTTKGAVDELLGEVRPPWPGQPWGLAAEIAGILGLRGPVAAVSGACASGTIALIRAAQAVKAEGGPACVLVVGIDLLSVFVTGGFARLQALTQTTCRPFDRSRDGLALGEGGGALLVAAAAQAKRLGWPILAEIDGWGVSGDAGHITAPCREASGLMRALALCTANGEKRVGAVNAHGTGTKFNDAMEIKAFAASLPADIPFHSLKGGIGHTLGAAGVIEAAIAVKALAAGVIPPTVGLIEPEAGSGLISGKLPLPLHHPSLLSCNSGFGGINAAVLLILPAGDS